MKKVDFSLFEFDPSDTSCAIGMRWSKIYKIHRRKKLKKENDCKIQNKAIEIGPSLARLLYEEISFFEATNVFMTSLSHHPKTKTLRQ